MPWNATAIREAIEAAKLKAPNGPYGESLKRVLDDFVSFASYHPQESIERCIDSYVANSRRLAADRRDGC